MSRTFELADTYVDAAAALDPISAEHMGVSGHETELTDHSPEGVAARVALARSTVAAVGDAPITGDADRIARDLLVERLSLDIESSDQGEHLRDLRNLGSPVQNGHDVFALMPQETQQDWERITSRLEAVPEYVDRVIASYRAGIARGLTAARRQALVCADQAALWSGQTGETSFFAALAGGAPEGGLRADAQRAGEAAAEAYGRLATFLRQEYAPVATTVDGVGAERYQLAARRYLGSSPDLAETYEWGWQELHRLEREMDRVAERVRPGAGRAEAIEFLRTDPSKSIEGIGALLAFLQETTDRTIREVAGIHFDIPEQMRRCECMEAPPGGAAAMYYTPPSEDFSRPGRTWYPTQGRSSFPLWTEVSTAYHEGVPGHHLQLGLTRCLGDRLSRYQSLLGWVSGHGEGWALYSERLMHELGYFENPDFEMGFLACQIFRAMRVVVDIGLHLGLAIPEDEAHHGGEVWNWEIALPFVNRYTPHPGDFARSELERYLGMPAQAISYKVGEREWLDIRVQLRARDGAAFNLKDFHMRALRMGSMGLAQMRRELLA